MAERRGGCATAILWIAAAVVLVPGLCMFYLFDAEFERRFAEYRTPAIWIAVIGLICLVVYLIYDFSRLRND
jgi:hypothetical protein